MSSIGEKRMMKRSDFAQKLLDDLRVRKEQHSIADNYAYSNRGFKGSKESRSKTTTFQDFNYGGTKSLTSSVEVSNQILPYGKGRSMEGFDLSKALAFALENAGKATRGDLSSNASIISFLHDVGKRSLGYGIGERRSIQQHTCSSNQQLPMVHVHIKEISKGAQKLNQIIKACSNGLSFRRGRYSIQCGEEIMEGAIELEQSLRLLVDIQQASSDYLTKKQRKSRIKLLEENDDDEEEEEEEEEAPNGNYKRIKEVAKADIEMRLLELNYQEDKNNKHRKQTSSFEDTQYRSLKPHKGRIPNVVAKLMGLGEFPEEEEKEEEETKNNNDASITSSENFTKHRVMQGNEKLVEVKAQRNTTSLDLLVHKETRTGNEINFKAKSHQKDTLVKDREKDDSMGRRRNKVLDKKDGEMKRKNAIRRDSSTTEAKHKVVARSIQKHSPKLSFEKKLIVHHSEEGNRKHKLQKVNGAMTNQSPKTLSSVDIQMKVPLTEKAKALRKSFSHVEIAQKEKEEETYKAKIFEKQNQEILNRNARFCEVTKPKESQKLHSKESDGRRDHQFLRSYKDNKQMKTGIKGSQVSSVEVKSSNKNVVEHKREIKDDSILLIAAERVPCQATPQNHHEIMFTDVMDQQAPISKSDGDSNRLSKTIYKGTKGEEKTNITLLEKRQEQTTSETTEALSENETNLKKIVVKSQLFLHTAEVLFKLNIPLHVLHETGASNYNQEDKNLILDCGYELMKRKGRFQELSVHPFVKSRISTCKVSSLDNLVRQLSKEFEKLRVYGRECYTGSLVEDYLPKILERDVHHKDPNLNSMWDMGWNDLMLAFIEKDDVVRDIERDLFNGLMEEITRDLICI